MAVNDLSDLFYETLRDVYWAEKQLVKVLPKMAKGAENENLAKAFTDHHAETKGHVERLDQIFEMIARPAKGKKCEAMAGLTAEGDEVMEEVEDATVRDVGIIATAQAVEHYEIARYGSLIAWAKLLGEDKAAGLLAKTLAEEKAADQKLTDISSGINPEAQAKAA